MSYPLIKPQSSVPEDLKKSPERFVGLEVILLFNWMWQVSHSCSHLTAAIHSSTHTCWHRPYFTRCSCRAVAVRVTGELLNSFKTQLKSATVCSTTRQELRSQARLSRTVRHKAELASIMNYISYASNIFFVSSLSQNRKNCNLWLSNWMMWMYLITDMFLTKTENEAFLHILNIAFSLKHFCLLSPVYGTRGRAGGNNNSLQPSDFNLSQGWCSSRSATWVLTHNSTTDCCYCLLLSSKRRIGGWNHSLRKRACSEGRQWRNISKIWLTNKE